MRATCTPHHTGYRGLVAVFAAVLLGACNTSQPEPPRDTSMGQFLVPMPAGIEHASGTRVVNAGTPIRNDTAEFEFGAGRLARYLATYAPSTMPTRTSIQLRQDASLPEEGYRLVISDEVLVEAATPAGLGHGIQTLRQLLAGAATTGGSAALPKLEINDAPRFGWRGMHLDVSRHFFDTDFVRRYIDLLAMHKMNVLHWHLTDDQGWRIEIKGYPRLTEVGAMRSGTVVGHTHDAGNTTDGIPHGGFYAQEEIREVVAYAAERGITVVPEIDVPGHASAIIAAYPEFGCGPTTGVKTHFGIFKHVLCPLDNTFEFLDTVIGEVAALFPGRYIHIGGDEVITEYWENCEACRALMARESIDDMAGLQHYFFARTAALVRKHGKEPIGWDEILSDDGEAAGVVMAWRGVERGVKAASHGHDVIMTPVTASYFDFYQSTSLDEPMSIHGLTRLKDVYAFEIAPTTLDADVREHILGGQGTLWTEYVPDAEKADLQVLPRMSALSEILWSPADKRDFPGFVRRLESFVPYLEAEGYSVSKAHYKPEIAAARNDAGGFDVTIDASAGTVHYTTDGSEPGPASAVYYTPFTLDDSAVVRARTQLESGDWLGDSRLSLERHLGLTAQLKGKGFSGNQDGWAQSVLLDGKLASDRIFHYGDWFGLDGDDFDVALEWPETVSVSRVSVGFNAGRYRILERPAGASVYGWRDGDWQLLAEAGADAIRSGGNRVELEFAPQESNRLRIVLKNPGPASSAEKEIDAATTLRLDEIVVH